MCTKKSTASSEVLFPVGAARLRPPSADFVGHGRFSAGSGCAFRHEDGGQAGGELPTLAPPARRSEWYFLFEEKVTLLPRVMTLPNTSE